jgi:hypothetical protein
MPLPGPLSGARHVVPLFGQHPLAALASDVDAELVEFAADPDLDPTILDTAVFPALLPDARVAEKPSHDLPPLGQETRHEKRACKWAVFI